MSFTSAEQDFIRRHNAIHDAFLAIRGRRKRRGKGGPWPTPLSFYKVYAMSYCFAWNEV